MKKICTFLFMVFFICSLSACGTNENDMVSEAVDVIKEHWEDLYETSEMESDGYFEIKNTRIVKIKENDIEEFENIDYIVEFVLYTDYFGSAPYYENVGIEDTVAVYEDGTMEVKSRNLIHNYRARNYCFDFSDFIESINDYGDKYNCIEDL